MQIYFRTFCAFSVPSAYSVKNKEALTEIKELQRIGCRFILEGSVPSLCLPCIL